MAPCSASVSPIQTTLQAPAPNTRWDLELLGVSSSPLGLWGHWKVPLWVFSPRPLHSGFSGVHRPSPGHFWPLLRSPEPGLTFLPVPVEDLNVFELDTDARSQGHRVCGIVFAPTLDGAVGVSPRGKGRAMSKTSTGLRREGIDGQGEGHDGSPHLSLQ